MSTTTTPEGPRPWSYEAIRGHLTNERLSSYFQSSSGDLTGAFHLYEWNMGAAAAVLSMTSMVEVIVRNALDKELTQWAESKADAGAWFDLVPLDRQGSSDLKKARERATRHGRHKEIHGKVVAELSLGFWRFLVESRYLTTLWVPATHRAFPVGPTDLRHRQRAVAKRLQQLTFVRNRAAHHEPIHRRDLTRDLGDAIELSTWVSPDAGAWVQAKSTLESVVASKPSMTR